MSRIFHPIISVPRRVGDPEPDDSGFSQEQRQFTATLRERYAEHVSALEAGDVERLLTFFTDDAVWMGSGWPSRFGKADLRALFKEVAGTAKVHCRSICAHVSGSAGWDFVDYAVMPNDAGVQPWNFRTAFQWMRENGAWRCNGVLCYAT